MHLNGKAIERAWTQVALLLSFPSLAQFWTIPAGSKTEI